MAHGIAGYPARLWGIILPLLRGLALRLLAGQVHKFYDKTWRWVDEAPAMPERNLDVWKFPSVFFY